MFKRNRLLEMLERDEIPLGMQCFTGHPALIEVMGMTGFDFVMIDCEHSGNDVCAMESRYAFRNFDQYTAWNNAEIALVPMIEHPDAVRDIDEICALEEVKIIVFGAGDLAYAMGEGTLMMKSPRVQEAYRAVLGAAQRSAVPFSTPHPQPAGSRSTTVCASFVSASTRLRSGASASKRSPRSTWGWTVRLSNALPHRKAPSLVEIQNARNIRACTARTRSTALPVSRAKSIS
jgi:2-keto-3-deoxy-L-rhamnonate aldolase RhmA